MLYQIPRCERAHLLGIYNAGVRHTTTPRFAAAVAAVSILSCASLSAQPRVILIIRHAEKPGNSMDPNLASRGFERAGALVKLFTESFDPADYLFASKISKHSNRCAETLAPLARAVHKTLNTNIADAEYAFLARDVLTNRQYRGKVVIICWHQAKIPALTKALGVSNAPKSWPNDVFDRIWRIRYSESGPTFDNLPQHLLPGDSQE